MTAVPVTVKTPPPSCSTALVRLGWTTTGRTGKPLSEPWNRITYMSSFRATTTLPAPARPSSAVCTASADALYERGAVVAVTTTLLSVGGVPAIPAVPVSVRVVTAPVVSKYVFSARGRSPLYTRYFVAPVMPVHVSVAGPVSAVTTEVSAEATDWSAPTNAV